MALLADLIQRRRFWKYGIIAHLKAASNLKTQILLTSVLMYSLCEAGLISIAGAA